MILWMSFSASVCVTYWSLHEKSLPVCIFCMSQKNALNQCLVFKRKKKTSFKWTLFQTFSQFQRCNIQGCAKDGYLDGECTSVYSQKYIPRKSIKNLILYKGLNCYCTQGRGGCWSLSQLSVGEGGVILVTSLHFTAGPKDKSLTLTPTANLGFPISTHVHCLCPVGGSGVPGQNLHSPVLGIKLTTFLLLVT